MEDEVGDDFPIEHCIEESAVGERLDRFLGMQHQPRYSRSYLAGLVRDGRVRVNDEAQKPSYRLELGDVVRGDIGPPPAESPEPEPVSLEVLYEDAHIAVLYKPAGLLVHPVGAHQGGTLVNGLIHRYPEIRKVGVVLRPGIVHRLDRHTSGVMVVALSNPARVGLVNQFKARTVKKEYHAVVEGKVALQSDFVDLPIGDHPRYHDRMRVDVKEGKSASTFYEVVERIGDFTHLRVQLLSGRTHQIRVHLSHLGHPVVGDPMYGGRAARVFSRLIERRRDAELPAPRLHRQALHAHRLRFTHPIDGREMDFTAPLPEDLSELLAIAREDADSR